MSFMFFDPEEEIDITHRRLPHWHQPGVTYFITFRTVDSLPAAVLRQWLEERVVWLRAHGLDPFARNWQEGLRRLPPAVRDEFRHRFTDAFHRYLDAGYGECLLKRPDLARVVANSLLHFDGQRYHIGDFVVMPNHVHLLVCLLGETRLDATCKSWKKYTSTQIHHILGRHGHFWQGESFDHMVRSPEQYAYCQRYIAENPQKASLRPGEYYLYQRPDTQSAVEASPRQRIGFESQPSVDDPT